MVELDALHNCLLVGGFAGVELNRKEIYMCAVEIKSCPLCGKTAYKYAHTWSQLAQETSRVLPTLIAMGVSPASIGTIVATAGSGLGFFSAPKDFFQVVFQGVKTTPLLVCTNCLRNVVMCPKCFDFLLLEKTPGVAELIDCPKCKARFGHSECSIDFDALGMKE